MRITQQLIFALAIPLVSQNLTPVEKLGKAIFFDQNLSINRNQACAACHAPESGWTGPDANVNAYGAVYQGSIVGRFGNRKPPSAAYATQSPIFSQTKKGLFIGGNFWDGRATGQRLGNPAADQAQGPFLNPAEQALPDSACIVHRVCTGNYPVAFTAVWGANACAIAWPANVEQMCQSGGAVTLSTGDRAKSQAAYDQVALSIAAYEGSGEVNAFSSKYDASFRGKAKLSDVERRGFALFNGKARCTGCHPSNGPGALFTDYSYDNLGIPKNLQNPVYGHDASYIDAGLGGYLKSIGAAPEIYQAEMGKTKVPTLRNVDKRPYAMFIKAYGHNGYFKSIEEIVHFYNTRDVYPTCTSGLIEKVNCWPAPENPMNVNRAELGNLGLSAEEEAAIVAYLKTLSDGYVR
jgi:cytochrome c peroxidase